MRVDDSEKKSDFYPGLVREWGYARYKYESNKTKAQTPPDKSTYSSIWELLSESTIRFREECIYKSRFLLDPNSNEETDFLTLALLIQSDSNGGVCEFSNDLEFQIQSILGKSPKSRWKLVFEKDASDLLRHQNLPIVFDLDSYYLSGNHSSEKKVAEKLKQRYARTLERVIKTEIDPSLKNPEILKEIIAKALSSSLYLVTGGPGTGKTTLVASILRSAEKSGIPLEKIALAAPTGKAAKRMEESIQSSGIGDEKIQSLTFSTIHRLLGYSPSRNSFYYSEDYPLPFELVIVDESTMVDIYLMDKLLSALPVNEKQSLIFLGDSNQLLSVNSGAVFSDLIKFNRNVSVLDTTYRQNEKSSIRVISETISKSAGSDTIPLDGYKISDWKNWSAEGFHFFHCENDSDAKEAVLRWSQQQFREDENKIVLTPYNKGPLGTEILNPFLKDPALQKREFSSGDPVIFTKNLYDAGFFNGETGVLNWKDDKWFLYRKGLPEEELPEQTFHAMELAYCITIHKSQGSEFDHVCIVLPEENEISSTILEKRILYTAITRAKISATVIGSIERWNQVISHTGLPRNSNLQKRLKGLIQ